MNTPVSSAHISRCEEILHLLGNATSEENREGDCTLVQKARKDLEKIRQHGDPPEITVAVYGDTGAGKSSLLNALLDQPSLLPTAGMGRACTSNVIKIEENKTSSDFEADIEFLTAEEWRKELNVLKGDMGQNDGDNDEDAEVYDEAHAKVAAVYGDFELRNLDTLLDDDTETAKLLGTVPKLSDSCARDLQDKISTYSETTDDDCQFWPLVKQVVLKVPDSGLCRSGVNLVDLPGVGDSNPARENVARKYMQTCDVLLVVTKIQRAVDNKTVKHTLGDKLFRQLLMDHTKTVVACTQADDVKPSEVIRKLKLPQAAEWTAEGQRYKKEEQVLQQKLADLKRDKQQQRLHAAIDQLKREKTSTCAVKRNEFVRNNILHKISSPYTPHDQDYPHDLKVFCVSSSDYINLSNLLTCDDDDDDKPPVFLSTEDTEIPGLRTYLQELVWEKQKKHGMSLQNDFQAIIDGILMYLINSKRGRKALKEELKCHLDTLQKEGQLILRELDSHLQSSWFAVLDAALDEATQEAIRWANPTVELWARPVNKRQRGQGGLHSNTYKATVRRFGIFRATRIGYIINMNQDLADPFVEILSKEWTPRFSEQAWIETVKSKIKEPASIAITRCTEAIIKSLGDSDATLLKDLTQLKTDTFRKLTRLDSLWEKTIDRQQRAVTHMITDFIQEQMQSAYEQCMKEEGPGAINRIKAFMASTIDQLKSNMFQQLKEKITVSLGQLKNGFMSEAKEILEDIVEDTEKQIMPLWQTQDEPIYLETLEKSEGLIQTLSEDFAKYKNGLHEPDCHQSSSSLKRQAGDIPTFPVPGSKLVKLSEEREKSGPE
ncbi:nuclear GTPase SLIP-GC-like isoform X2 [Haliotis rufescens]|uniref:nuclear GTPase SLIP-GC-like isoform X2 n=1 Tax=Haliotis rufescens TaxID=6454 RepID=UPI00201ED89D|nr:nuclear GTPase SLIP-GC-like isoform X2 [Haliotis rufescens]